MDETPKFTFSKQLAQEFINALITDKSIEPPADGWTVDNALMLAGVCLLQAVRSYAPAGFEQMTDQERENTLNYSKAMMFKLIAKNFQNAARVYQGKYDDDNTITFGPVDPEINWAALGAGGSFNERK